MIYRIDRRLRVRLVEAGVLTPHIAARFSWPNASDAPAESRTAWHHARPIRSSDLLGVPMINAAAVRTTRAVPSTEVDNRAAYLGFAFAYVFGHGASMLSGAGLVTMPSWLPIALLATGILTGVTFATTASLRAQRVASEGRRRAEKLVGMAWLTGFTALALAVTGLSAVFDEPELQTVLWPAGSAVVVGLIYIAEGAIRGNVLHYNLGTWLALVAAATLFVPGAGFFGLLTVLGGGAYLLAAFLERRRLALLAV